MAANDWVKMRTDLYRDPKVCVMADRLMDEEGELARYVDQNRQRQMTVTRNVMRNVTVGALVTVWGVTRHRGKRIGYDLLIRGATVSVVDDIADLPGFGEAMQSVGWAVETQEGVVFPEFFAEYNADPSEDSREKNAERQRRYRERRNGERNVMRNVTSNAREEKNREEKRDNSTHAQARGDWSHLSDAIQRAIKFWNQYWSETHGSGKPDSPTRIESMLATAKSAGWSDEKIAESITVSIGWNAKSWRDPEADHDKATKARINGRQKPPKMSIEEIIGQ